MFLKYTGSSSITVETWFWNSTLVQNDVVQTTETAWNNLLNLYSWSFSVATSGLKYETATVTITSATSWTATVTSWSTILGWYVSAITGAERVKTLWVTGTTLTVNLTGSDTATVVVILLKA